jgi:uncharacterized protein YdaU (DUF1376 family)
MSAILKLILEAFAGTFLDALADAFKDWNNGRMREDLGAANQRETDMRAENAKVAEADRARDDVRNGGGVPVEIDPFNRDNR